MRAFCLLALLLVLPFGEAHPQAPSSGAEYRIVEEESVVAVITRRAGPAARLAHDHFVRAGAFRADLSFDPEEPTEARLDLVVRVADLRVDDDHRYQVEGRLMELEIMEGPFQEVSEREGRDIRLAMLGEDQLDAVNHPALEVRTRAVRELGAEGYAIEIEMTLREETRSLELEARLEEGDGSRYRIEAWGSANFTDFGIEPYRAFLGAVQNRDTFYLYLDLRLEPES